MGNDESCHRKHPEDHEEEREGEEQLEPPCLGAVETIVRTNVELMDSGSEDEEFDDVVTVLALKLTKIQRNRIPRYFEEVLADAAPIFIHDRRQCRQDAAN
ncbi:hypothetical protein HPB50_003096 [Hyalomma asiaticum]|uniref:Uncharacterized protein n=1 Tax=Hyalomma asiaticum TaxID=266040 RepID=A0ACB7RH05_HYAAI|nr:hypothetical protein HPB50_003096 [Hyalomma asiaticum]